MSIQEKLQTKLKPHTDKILNNQADDFDYLPAILDYLIKEYENQKRDISKLITNQQNRISDFQKELSVEISSAKENQETQIAKLSRTLNETIEQAGNNQKQVITDLKADNQALQVRISDFQKELSVEISSAKENQETQIAKLSRTLNETIEQAGNNQKQVIADLKNDNQALKAEVASLVSYMKMEKWIIALTFLIIVVIAIFVFFMMPNCHG